MPVPRDKPFIAATWLSKLLVGTNSCEWAVWFKAHNQRHDGERVPSKIDWTPYRIAHTDLLNRTREEHEGLGYTVTTEQQNRFLLRGKVATLMGVPDLIAVKGAEGIVIDAKATRPQPWHPTQVQLYMWATPQADPRFKQVVFTGLLCYADSKIAIQTPAVNEAFVTSVTGLIKRVAGMQQARKVPSAVECRYCDITHLHCPDRQAGDEQVEGETDDF